MLLPRHAVISVQEVHLAVGLEGAGWHPAAWREPDARPAELFTARYWQDLVAEAERGLLDFVTIEDSLGLQDGPDDRVRGRLDAVLIAARVAPLTRRIGLVPAAVVTHTEPFHISKAIATLDYVSLGRAGWQVTVSGRQEEADHFGRRQLAGADLWTEAADYVEVVRRLWDSWEDDAEIRDAATGRFIDRNKLRYIDFTGPWFSVKGPSITPRPPQGQPLVVAGRDDVGADVVIVPAGPHDAAAPHVFGDLVVFLDETAERARARKARLDELAGEDWTPDVPVFTGTPAQLAERLTGLTGFTGFRLRPGALPHDLLAITRNLVPLLGITDGPHQTLRGRLGLERPANRYAVSTRDES
jgi:alkanesulfonate monooxygenase SsuD/methylene tetrahydromethanopterin reductase-like flavin-dependent oxidoreductase (luciferase family)